MNGLSVGRDGEAVVVTREFEGERWAMTFTQAELRWLAEQGGGPRPSIVPKIVAGSESPSVALAAFVAQELEHWGFDVERTEGAVEVGLDDERNLLVRVQRVDP